MERNGKQQGAVGENNPSSHSASQVTSESTYLRCAPSSFMAITTEVLPGMSSSRASCVALSGRNLTNSMQWVSAEISIMHACYHNVGWYTIVIKI